MIKLNRIGNKLGLAGAVGILLSAGLIANQRMSEGTVAAVNDRADHAQHVAEYALAASAELRQTQLAGRTIRLARSPAEVDKSLADLHKAATSEANTLDAAYATAMKPESKERLLKIKSLMTSYIAAMEDLAKAQLTLLTLVDKRNVISAEWTKTFEAVLISPVLARSDARPEVESLLHQADAKVNALRALVWRFGATGDTKLVEQVARTRSALEEILKRTLAKDDDKEFQVVIASLDSIVKRFVDANDESVKTEALKEEIVQNRGLKMVSESSDLMEIAVSTAQASNKASKEEAVAETASADRISFAMAIVVMISVIVSMVFSFLGVARPMTRLNAALGQMAGGHLDVVIPGADRGDEIGDLAKTVTVIRANAEQKARDEAAAKISQDQLAAERRKADMVRLADQFEGAVGEIIETVSSASTELEASALR
jgi:hypothetical protein